MRCGIRQVSKQIYKDWLEIKGTVKVDGKPKRKRIMIIDRQRGKIDIVYSNSEGKCVWRADKKVYEQNEARVLVVALDDDMIFNAEVADFVTPAIARVEVRL